MDVSGIAGQECTAFPKVIGHPMVHAVGRKPVYALNVDTHPLHHALAHVAPVQFVPLLFGFLAYCADEPRAPFALQREDGEKIGSVQAHVYFAIHGRSAAFHVGDVKKVSVRSARESDPQPLADRRMRAIASGNVAGFALFRCIAWLFQPSDDTAVRNLEAQEFGLALDLHSSLRQAIDQQTFVLVLRINQRVRKRTQPRAHVAEDGACRRFSGHPQVYGRHLSPALDDRFGETDLLIQLERSCLHGKRARRGPRFRGLVDDPYARAQPPQP